LLSGIIAVILIMKTDICTLFTYKPYDML